MALLQNGHIIMLHFCGPSQLNYFISGKRSSASKGRYKEAYRMVPFNLDDQPLLAVEWANRIYIRLDRALPFGLRSAPKIFLQ